MENRRWFLTVLEAGGPRPPAGRAGVFGGPGGRSLPRASLLGSSPRLQVAVPLCTSVSDCLFSRGHQSSPWAHLQTRFKSFTSARTRHPNTVTFRGPGVRTQRVNPGGSVLLPKGNAPAVPTAGGRAPCLRETLASSSAPRLQRAFVGHDSQVQSDAFGIRFGILF